MPRFALASCDKDRNTLEIEEPEFETEQAAEAALKAGGYVEISPCLWEADPGQFACVVDTW